MGALAENKWSGLIDLLTLQVCGWRRKSIRSCVVWYVVVSLQGVLIGLL